MNYGELKHNLISKGFAEESDYTEFEDLGYTYDAINQAVDEISDWFPIQAYFDIEVDETDTGIYMIDLGDRNGFIALGETPVLFEKDGEEVWRKFTEYDIEMDRIIRFKADDYKGSFRFYYYKAPTPVTESTADTFTFELPLVAHKLIPLLTAYYLWLDDDERKAVMYKNDYQDALNNALQRNRPPRAKVETSKWGDI